MLQKMSEALRIPVSNIKGLITTQNLFNVGMQLFTFGTFMPLAKPYSIYTEIRTDFRDNEIIEGIAFIAGGILTTGSIAYCKYLQMLPAKENDSETSFLVQTKNNSYDLNNGTKSSSKGAEVLHLLVGMVHIPADILLQIAAINKSFYHNWKITLPFYAYIPGIISLGIQDLRVLSQTAGANNRLGNFLEQLKETIPGKLLESIAVSHRAAAAKMSFEQLSASNPYLNYIHYPQTCNIFSIIPRWTNNITKKKSDKLPLSKQGCISNTLMFLFVFSYAIEDAALYIYAFPELAKLGPTTQLALVSALTLAEIPVYAEKANIAAKWTVKKVGGCGSSIHAFFREKSTEKSKLLNNDNLVDNNGYLDASSNHSEPQLPINNSLNY